MKQVEFSLPVLANHPHPVFFVRLFGGDLLSSSQVKNGIDAVVLVDDVDFENSAERPYRSNNACSWIKKSK